MRLRYVTGWVWGGAHHIGLCVEIPLRGGLSQATFPP